MADHDYYKMRAGCGRIALVTAANNPPATAADIVRGCMAGFVLAASHFDGWDSVIHHVNQLAAAARVPAEVQKPALKLVEGGKS